MAEAFTLIEATRARQVPATVAGQRVRLAPDGVREALGWELKPQGLCRGEFCVSIRDPEQLLGADGIDLHGLADALALPLAVDVEERVAVLGTAAAERVRQLDSLDAPDFELPDLSGRLHRLSEHRGKKVLLIVYASW